MSSPTREVIAAQNGDYDDPEEYEAGMAQLEAERRRYWEEHA
jgi:hypothetical protein